MSLEAPLPVGYNAPTPDKAIEIKTYPTVRRAEVSSEDIDTKKGRGSSNAFKRLFKHISSRKIAMTSPVETDFIGLSSTFLDGPTAESWTMSFLYRTPELGPVGDAGDSVEVVDRPEVTVISVGLSGSYKLDLVAEGVKILT